MPKQIELVIEKINRGNWLRVTVPYRTTMTMTATLQNKTGGVLKAVNLMTGNNLIDLEAIAKQAVQIRIDTPFETLLKEMVLE